MSIRSDRSVESDLPALGVGITYSPALDTLLQQDSSFVDLVEIEPQTVWLERPGAEERYSFSDRVLGHISKLPGRKLVHSVGTPVGGTVHPESQQLTLLRSIITRLGSPWMSDHLSFNSTPDFRTGFFLPPRQTDAGVAIAASSVAALKAALSIPVAVETGVSYLRPRRDEMPDGLFVDAVVREADCGLLLDMHNVFANAVNGRQQVQEFLSQIPLDRVWEIHLAGGMNLDGFWLDAHSGAIPDALFGIVREVVPSLPNLKAMVFEIFPSFVPVLGFDAIRTQIDRLRELWELRRPQLYNGALPAREQRVGTAQSDGVSPAAWESTLGALVIGRSPEDRLARELASDPGVALVQQLIREFRASMIVNLLRLTARLLLLALGESVFRAILADFWSRTPPQLYASSEATEFADYLEALDLKVPRLYDVLRFERAVLATLMDEQSRLVIFEFDPVPLLRGLAEGRLPEMVGKEGRFEIEVTADGPAWMPGLNADTALQAFPMH